MKKIFTLFTALALLCTVGCEEQGDDNVNPNDKPNPEQPEEKPDDGSEIPDDAYITLNKEVLTFVPDGESVEVKVYSNYEWTLTNNCDWVTTSISGGEASEEGTTITLTADLTYDDREGTITFSCGKAKKLLVVSQSLKEVIIADENNVFNVPAEGGNAIINYQTSVECEVIIPEEAKSWISLAPATRALVSESATLTVAENTTYSERSAVVKVVKVGDNTLFAEYTINQVQNDAIIADENNTLNLTGLAQSINIAYQTNVECEVVIPEEAKSWISFAPATRALVNESATLNIAENNTGAERSVVVKVVAANNKELVAEYTITQNQRYFMEYTSEGGYTVSPYNSSAFDATIIRNKYIDGKGYIDFDAPITSIGNNAFYDRRSLTSVTIPDSVTSIGDSAFYDCRSLTSVTIPDSVTSIGDSAFYYCDSLTSVYITDIAAWCNISFGNSSSNPLSYAGNLYLNNELVTDLIIPDSVISIGDGVFNACTSLTSVTIGDSVTSIGNNAFSYCDSLESITIPDSVTSIGDGAFCRCTSLTSVTIGNGVTSIGFGAFRFCTSLKSITIPDSVTSIGGSAFSDCTWLTSITIPDSVTSIGGSAFSDCTWLTSVTIPDGVTEIGRCTFSSCRSLTSVTIPDSVTEIGERAFEDCLSLTSVTIGNGVTTIGDSAFYNCLSLTSITIPYNVTSIGNEAFNECNKLRSVTIGNGVTSIGGSAFSDCTSLTSVYITDIAAWCNISFGNNVSNPLYYAGNLYLNNELVTDLIIPDSVTSIGDRTFCYCDSLTSVTIPDSVTSIGDEAFRGCTSLTSVTIPDSVTSIGSYAFRYCDSLTSVTIPDSVTEIGASAFYECDSLTSVTIGNGVTSIGGSAFSDCTSLTSVYITDIAAWCNISFGNNVSNPLRYAGNLYLNNELVTDLIIPDGATKIGSYAFYNCTSLTSVTIGDGVTTIGEKAFYNCTSLTSVTIPDSVTSIGERAFQECTSLTSVTIGNGVTEIGQCAFYKCTSLKEVYCKPTTPPTGGSSMFDENASGRKIYVPRDSVEAYKSAQYWKNYTASIGGYDF